MVHQTTRPFTTTKQANAMIHGRQSMNLSAKRLLLLAGNKIDATAAEPNEVRISFEECANSITTRATKNWKGRKRILEKIFTNLNANPLVLEFTDKKTDKRVYEFHNWLQSLIIDERTKEIILVYTDVIRTYFVYLQGQSYTNTLSDAGKYRSVFTIRIKEIIELELFKKKPYFYIPLTTLKWQLGVEKCYGRFNDFRRRVLETAQKELKDKQSPIQFTFDVLGIRGQVVQKGAHAIRFYPKLIAAGEEQADSAQEPVGAVPKKPKPATIHQEYLSKYPVVCKTLKGWGIAEIHIQQHIEQKGIDVVKSAIEVVVSNKQVTNPAGLYIRSLEKGWETEQVIKQRAAKATKKRVTTMAQEQETRDKLKKAIVVEASTRDKRICDGLIAAENGLLEKVYQQLLDKHRKSRGGISMSSIPDTPVTTYQNARHRWRMVEAIKVLFPESFDFLVVDWQQERPLEHQEILRQATRYYEAKVRQTSHSAEEKKQLIAALMERKFEQLYPSQKRET